MTRGRHRIWIAAGVTFWSLGIFAQTSEETAILRQTFIKEAQQARIAGNHSESLSLALQAAQIRMTPSLRLFIAQEQSQVGQLANSLHNAEVCVFEATADKELKNRKAILRTCKDLMADIQKSAGRIIVSLPTPAPPQVRVLIASQEVDESFYGRPYFVTPGSVRIEASAPGYLRYEHELELEAQEEVALTILLPPEPGTLEALQRPTLADSAAPESKNPQPLATREVAVLPPEVERQSGRSIGPYVLLGAGAASLGASAVFLILRSDALNSLEKQCGGPGNSLCTETAEARALDRKVSRYTVFSDIALGVGGAALVAGTIWWFAAKSRGSGTPRHAELLITPIPGGAAVGVQGSL